jgi:hypothetical protein
MVDARRSGPSVEVEDGWEVKRKHRPSRSLRSPPPARSPPAARQVPTDLVGCYSTALPPTMSMCIAPFRRGASTTTGWATASRTVTVLGSGRRLVAHAVRLALSRLSGLGRARRGVGACAATTVARFFFGVAGGAPPASPRCRSSGGAARGAPSGRPAWGDSGHRSLVVVACPQITLPTLLRGGLSRWWVRSHPPRLY